MDYICWIRIPGAWLHSVCNDLMVSSPTSSDTACWNVWALKAGRWQKHFLDERINRSITKAVTVCCDSTRNRIRKYTGPKTYTQRSGTRYSSHFMDKKSKAYVDRVQAPLWFHRSHAPCGFPSPRLACLKASFGSEEPNPWQLHGKVLYAISLR